MIYNSKSEHSISREEEYWQVVLILRRLSDKYRIQLESLAKQLLPSQKPGKRLSDNEGGSLGPGQGTDPLRSKCNLRTM